MQTKMREPLTIILAADSAVPEAVAFRASEVWDEDQEKYVPRGVDEPIPVPSKLEICGKCGGRGKHSLRFGAFSGDRLAEAREDEEFWEGYTSGAFDEPCDRCGGTGRVNVPDEQRCSPELLAAIQEYDEEEADYRAERHAEMRAQYGLEWGPEWGDE